MGIVSIISSAYFMLGDNIYSKKISKAFLITSNLANRIRRCNNENTLIYLSESEKEYLIERKIISLSINDNNPICIQSDMNECRLFIQLTNKCNLHCKHCFVESDMKNEDFYTFERVRNLIDTAVSYGINRIDFTGGEVFVQTYFLDILSYLDLLPVSYSFFTNLTIPDEETLSRLVNLNGLMCIITSLDYFGEKHNIFRGNQHAFQKTIKNIMWLRDRGVKVVVNIMVMDDNHDDVTKMTDFLLSESIEVHFDTVIECGRAKGGSLSNKNDNNNNNNIRFINELLNNIRMRGVQVDNMAGSCGVSKTLIFAHYTGEFMLCPGLTEDISPKYHLGSDMRVAWEKANKMNIECSKKQCEHWSKCSHGCRLRALVDNGMDDAPDDMMCRLMSIEE